MNTQHRTIHIYDFIREVEQALVLVIHESLEQKHMQAIEAKKIAQDFLALFPINDISDLCNKLYSLCEKHPITRSLFLTYAKPHEKHMSNKKATVLFDLMQREKIEKAYYLVKGGIL